MKIKFRKGYVFMLCINCGSEMRIDDVGYNFKGNKDNYFVCDKCNCCCVEKIRYGKTVEVEWDKSDCDD